MCERGETNPGQSVEPDLQVLSTRFTGNFRCSDFGAMSKTVDCSRRISESLGRSAVAAPRR